MSANDKEAIDAFKADYSRFYAQVNPHLGAEKFYKDCLYYYRGEVLPALPGEKTARILEIGCATGRLLRFLRESGYERVGGVEIDRKLYEEAREYIGKDVEFIEHGDALDYLKTASRRFDMVIAMDVIEHFAVADAAELSRLAHRVLDPGGRFLLRTKNMANILGICARYSDLTHQMGYTEGSLRELLLLCGFERAEVVVPKFGWMHFQTVRLVVTNLIHRLLFAMQGQPPCVRFDPNIVMCAYKSASPS